LSQIPPKFEFCVKFFYTKAESVAEDAGDTETKEPSDVDPSKLWTGKQTRYLNNFKIYS
jgi:hypothetical protein